MVPNQSKVSNLQRAIIRTYTATKPDTTHVSVCTVRMRIIRGVGMGSWTQDYVCKISWHEHYILG